MRRRGAGRARNDPTRRTDPAMMTLGGGCVPLVVPRRLRAGLSPPRASRERAAALTRV